MTFRYSSLGLSGLMMFTLACGGGAPREEVSRSTPTIANEAVDPAPPADASPVEVSMGLRDVGTDVETMMQVEPSRRTPALYFRLSELEEECADISVYFTYDSATLSPEAREALDRLAQCYDMTSLRSIEVVGHADPRGTEAYNHELAMERASAVAAYLRDEGVTAPEVEVISRGEQAARWRLFWAEDRRVEIDAQPDADAD